MKTLLTLIILLLTVDLSVAQDTFTLNDAIKAALESNHNVRISDIEQDKAENRVTRGNSGQLPSLSFNSDLNWSYSDIELTPGSFFENLINPGGGEGQFPAAIKYDGVSSTGFNAGLGTQFVIYDGMKGRLRYRMLETGSDLAGLQHRSEMESTVLDITRGYVQAASIQNTISLKELSLIQSLDRYHMIETRREYGQASEQQFLQALADLKTDSTEYRDLILQYETAYRDLHTVIGWNKRDIKPLDQEIQSTDMPNYDELLHSLLENNTALNVRQVRIEHAEIDQKLTRANFLPILTANAQYGYNYQYASDGQFETQDQLGVMGGVSLKIPIFTGGRAKTASQNARASLRQEEIRYDESEQQLRTQFKNSWEQLLHLENMLVTELSNLAVYERNYERAKDSFERGLITGVELRAAQLSLENVRLRISETRFQIKLTETTLLYLSGSLLYMN
jgi:outer membrane protein